MVARDAEGFERKIPWHASAARMNRRVSPGGWRISSDRCEKKSAHGAMLRTAPVKLTLSSLPAQACILRFL